MFYDGYVENLAKKIDLEMSNLKAEYGFKLGRDFEFIICKLLRTILPSKYGVVRGFVVAQDGEKAGDDIIIYDKSRFPTLLNRTAEEAVTVDENIPIEAVCAYIEVKTSISIKDEPEKRNTLRRSISQVQKVISVVGKRKPCPPTRILPYFQLPEGTVQTQPHLPKIKNPLFTMLLVRDVRATSSGKILAGDEVEKAVEKHGKQLKTPLPDITILGKDNILLPLFKNPNGKGPSIYEGPFFVAGATPTRLTTHGFGFAIGIVALMEALDWISLGEMPSKYIIHDAIMNNPSRNKKK